MINKLVNYYNSQYSEDKVIVWVFIITEVFLFFIGLVLYVMYIMVLVLNGVVESLDS